MASNVCSNCGVDFGYPQGLSVHKELGCEWGDDYRSETKYCCGMIYEEGETVCKSCGDPL